MALTKLASGKMLFVYLKYNSGSIFYRVLSASWGSVQTVGSTGMSSGTIKQLSAASDSTGKPYVAYVTGGTYGALKVATWTTSGSSPTIQTADSTKSHSLPSISMFFDSIAVYSISGGKIWATMNIFGIWAAPKKAYTGEVAINQLTSGLDTSNQFVHVMYTEGSGPFTIKVNGFSIGLPLGLYDQTCGGGFTNHHPAPDWVNSVISPTTRAQVETILTNSGAHDTANYVPNTNSNDWTRWTSDYGCANGIFRDHLFIAQSGSQWTYNQQGHIGSTNFGEPNPEIFNYGWPTLWWGPYAQWWHAHF